MDLKKSAQIPLKTLLAQIDATADGLSSARAANLLEQYGPNTLHEQKHSKLQLFISQFTNAVVGVLALAAVLSLFLGDLKDFFLILGILIVNGILGFWQELRAENSIAALKKLTESKIAVLRDGKTTELPSAHLVPGDVIILHEGNTIPADARLLESTGLLVDEASLTGESVPAEKDANGKADESSPYDLPTIVLSGTSVVKGSAKAVVIATGAKTYFASIAEKAKEKSPQSPLTIAVSKFSRRYVILILALLAIVGIAGLVQGRTIADLALLLVAQLVSAIPEGLPIVVTLVLAIGALRLSRQKTLVRHLPAVETLGSATIIASDKTGTITEGNLAVKAYYAPDLQKLKLIASLANECKQHNADPLDNALAKWLGPELDDLHEKHECLVLHPFDTQLKMMGSVHRHNKVETLYVKGAYESLKARGTSSPIFDKRHDELAAQGLRVLAFGTARGPHHKIHEWKVHIEGLIGFYDPPKRNVKEAVATARAAGIRVIMITGDNPLTAKAVASEVGIYTPGDRVTTGPELENQSDEQIMQELHNTTVLARVLPEHKYKIVKLLQQSGHIVAVTGDGINDVPALKAADLGIAMGKGTEAAKSVSKMILADDNLGVIIDAIRQGRAIADNIRKVIYYLVSTCLGQIGLISASILAGLPLPLLPTQILWINLVADGVLDKTFPFIKGEPDIMSRKPRQPDKQFFDKAQILRILFASAAQALIHFALFTYLLNLGWEYPSIVTVVFTSMVICQWINGIQAQKETEPFLKRIGYSLTVNPYLWVGISIGIALQLFAVYVANSVFHTVPLSLDQLVYVAIPTITFFVLIEARKWFETIKNKK